MFVFAGYVQWISRLQYLKRQDHFSLREFLNFYKHPYHHRTCVCVCVCVAYTCAHTCSLMCIHTKDRGWSHASPSVCILLNPGLATAAEIAHQQTQEFACLCPHRIGLQSSTIKPGSEPRSICWSSNHFTPWAQPCSFLLTLRLSEQEATPHRHSDLPPETQVHSVTFKIREKALNNMLLVFCEEKCEFNFVFFNYYF